MTDVTIHPYPQKTPPAAARQIPFYPAKDFVVVRPAKPKTKEGSIALPQVSAGKPWHGELISWDETDEELEEQFNSSERVGDSDSIVVWYSRSFPMEPIQMAREDGTWEEGDLVVLHKQAIRGMWFCMRNETEKLLNPDEKPIDPALERELVKVREAQT